MVCQWEKGGSASHYNFGHCAVFVRAYVYAIECVMERRNDVDTTNGDVFMCTP